MSSLLGNPMIPFIFVGIFGFVLGAVLAVLFSGRGKQEDEQPAPEKRRPGEVRVWHEGALSRIITEMDGQTFSSAKELSNEQRQRLMRLLRDWASWMEVTRARQPQAAPVASKAETPAARPQPIPAPKPAAPPPAADSKQPAAISIVVQINNILQEMLEAGSAKAKGIRLVEDPRNGVTVWVGLSHYDSIDSVGDPEALALIRAAVAEWERRAEGRSV